MNFRLFLRFFAASLLLVYLSAFAFNWLGGSAFFPGNSTVLHLLVAFLAAVASYALMRHVDSEFGGLAGKMEDISRQIPGGPGQAPSADEMERAFSLAHSLSGGVKKSLEELGEEKEKARAIVGQMDDGIAVLGRNGRTKLCNAAFCAALGLENPSVCAGKPLAEITRNQEFLEAYSLYQESGQVVKAGLSFGGPGGGRSYHLRISPLAHRHGSGQTLLVLRDVTEHVMTERMRSDFVANVSHELKTPLTAILGFVETLEEGAVDDPEQARRFLGIIKRHSERLSRLTDDLLVLSNIELGKTALQLGETDTVGLLQSVTHMFSKTAKERNVGLATSIEEDAGTVYADRDKLIQIMINILDNAVKYTPDGGEVTTSCRLLTVTPENKEKFDYRNFDGTSMLPARKTDWERSYVEFSVTDTGEGIPDESIPRLVERFYRVDKARSRSLGGTGLGLSIVKHLVMAHKGSLRIESGPGKGATVRFIIPARHTGLLSEKDNISEGEET